MTSGPARSTSEASNARPRTTAKNRNENLVTELTRGIKNSLVSELRLASVPRDTQLFELVFEFLESLFFRQPIRLIEAAMMRNPDSQHSFWLGVAWAT